MMVGIVSGDQFPGGWVSAGLVLLTAIIVIGRSVRQQRNACISPFILMAAAGYLMIQPWAAPFPSDHHIRRFIDSGRWTIMGKICAPPILKNNCTSLILATQRLENSDESIDVIGRIRVSVKGDRSDLGQGDRLTFVGKILPFRNFNNPGGFDYRKYMHYGGIWATSYVSSGGITVLDRKEWKGIHRMVQNCRRHISRQIDQVAVGDENQTLKALIVGERQNLSSPLREVFTRCGVAHVLAISGLHIGMIALVVYWAVRKILLQIPWFLWRGWASKGAALGSVGPIVFYGFISGMSPSTQRAIVMVCVFLTAVCVEREHDPLNTLAVAALLLLILHPPSLFSISFQLSFMAVLAILSGMEFSKIFRPREACEPCGLKMKVVFIALPTLFATVGTWPLVMRYFNQVSFIGPVMNLFIVPLVGWLIVPIGLFSTACGLVGFDFSLPALHVCSFIAGVMIRIVKWASTFPLAAVHTVTPSLFEIVWFYAFVWAMMKIIRQWMENRNDTASCLANSLIRPVEDGRFSADSSGDRHGRLSKPCLMWRRVLTNCFSGQKTVRWLCSVIVVAACADVWYCLYKRFRHNDLRVTILDVGQGSSALLELPGGYTMLMDGGGFSDNSRFDIGARVVAPCLWRKKIKTVDTLILSHPDSDHLNGLIYIARHFHVKNIWSNGEVANTRSYQQFVKILKEKNIKSPEYPDLPRNQTINHVTFHVLYPRDEFSALSAVDKWRDTNNNSLVVKVQFKEVSFLFPGDISVRAEKELIETAGNRARSTVLISPHHGSRTSSSAAFLDQVNPDVVIVSHGKTRYRKALYAPVIERYRRRDCDVFNTCDHGAVMMTTDGASLEIDTVLPTASCS